MDVCDIVFFSPSPKLVPHFDDFGQVKVSGSAKTAEVIVIEIRIGGHFLVNVLFEKRESLLLFWREVAWISCVAFHYPTKINLLTVLKKKQARKQSLMIFDQFDKFDFNLKD